MFRTHSGFVVLLLCLFVAQPVLAQGGRVVEDTLHTIALEGNLLGDSPDRSVIVYLPPSYDENPDRRYPVMYLLHGYTMNDRWWTGNPYDIFNTIPSLDRFMTAHPDLELIVVMPDAYNKYLGSWYKNSPVTGDWEDFIVKELVDYIDRTYRTFPQAAHRGISGYSMGGAGALDFAMRHPEVYSAVYALSGGGPLLESHWSRDEEQWRQMLSLTDPSEIEGWPLLLSAAVAFSPNPDNPPWLADFPFELVDGELRRRDSVWKKWLSTHNMEVVARTHRANVRDLWVGFCRGTEEDIEEARALSQVFADLGAPHLYEEFEGDHNCCVPEQIETKILPFLGRALAGTLPRIQSVTTTAGIAVTGQSMPVEVGVLLDAPPEATGIFPEMRLAGVYGKRGKRVL